MTESSFKKIGKSAGGKTEIVSGLHAGDQVLTSKP